MSIKISAKSLTDLERTILNFIWENNNNNNKNQEAKRILYNKGTSGDITIPDFKLH